MVRPFARTRVLVVVLLLLATFAGTLAEIPRPTAAAPTITEFPTYSVTLGGTSYITTGPDGNVWFTEVRRIGRITTAGVVTSFSIPVDVDNDLSGIAAGPDGNLWFTLAGSNKIGKLTTAGVSTMFDVPTAFSAPRGIANGPDGNLWFVEVSGNKIGKVTPAGVVTEYPVPTADSLLSGIAAGPDGNLWVAEAGGDKSGGGTTGGGGA